MAAMPTRRFNTSGVCKPSKHYMIPAVPRITGISDMIENEYYFVIHAPRQSGKTTCLTALTDRINSEGNYYAITCSLASLRDIHNDEKAMSRVVSRINVALESSDVDELHKLAYVFNSSRYMADADGKVQLMLRDLSHALNRELVVFFDEADCLMEAPLILFLAQIRDGYLRRSNLPRSRFPRSMALVGMRDIRDYLTIVRADGESQGPGGSPFNVRDESLSLADFTREEIEVLYGQHTAETGQIFEPEAVDRAWHWTEGQPWLVNALARD
ncbi:MAG: ATP-binding protein, partial [Deltaproteobacteria bacterium]|nr:ATP-binding protein [Deltaproteobacteria bacterium]